MAVENLQDILVDADGEQMTIAKLLGVSLIFIGKGKPPHISLKINSYKSYAQYATKQHVSCQQHRHTTTTTVDDATSSSLLLLSLEPTAEFGKCINIMFFAFI